MKTQATPVDPIDPVDEYIKGEYKHGFVTDIETEMLEPGLNEDVIRFISAKKNEPEFMLEWRLKAYRHWLTMKEPKWAHVQYPPIDFNDIIYWAAPKSKSDGPKSLDEVDPELLRTYEKDRKSTRLNSSHVRISYAVFCL